MKLVHRRLTLLFLLFIAAAPYGRSQSILIQDKQESADDMRQFRLSQQYQAVDKHEQAVAILQRLYEKQPGNVRYYNQLLESLIQLSRIDEALALINEQKKHDPANLRYEIDYGSVLYKDGKRDEAKKNWEDALEKHRNNVAIYTLVANAMLTHRLFDEAIEVYKRAYSEHPNRTYFLQNIASLYRNRFENAKALEYYLQYLSKEPDQYNSVARQILSLPLERDEVKDVTKMVEAEARNSDNPEFQLLLAKFYQKYEMYEEALNVYSALEDAESQGKYLLSFGRTMQADSLYDLSLRSYEAIIERYPESEYLLHAYLGAARCNLELAQMQNDQALAQKAIGIINHVREHYPRHPEVAELSLVEGIIYKEFFFDIDKAINVFSIIINTYRDKQEILERASLLLGESYIIRGDLAKAASLLANVHSDALRAEALFRIAKIEFYRHNFDNCRNHLDKIIQLDGPGGTVTNDALELQLLLQHAASHPAALKLYAEADLLVFQGKKSQAISKIKSGLKENPPNDLRVEMLLRAARLAQEIQEPENAIEFCNEVIQDSTMHIYADEALFVMASVFENDLGDRSRAFQLYDRLLIEFPQSRFSHAARERLLKIREQLKEVMP